MDAGLADMLRVVQKTMNRWAILEYGKPFEDLDEKGRGKIAGTIGTSYPELAQDEKISREIQRWVNSFNRPL